MTNFPREGEPAPEHDWGRRQIKAFQVQGTACAEAGQREVTHRTGGAPSHLVWLEQRL